MEDSEYQKNIKKLRNFFEKKERFDDDRGEYFAYVVKNNDIETAKFLVEKMKSGEYYARMCYCVMAIEMAKTDELYNISDDAFITMHSMSSSVNNLN